MDATQHRSDRRANHGAGDGQVVDAQGRCIESDEGWASNDIRCRHCDSRSAPNGRGPPSLPSGPKIPHLGR